MYKNLILIFASLDFLSSLDFLRPFWDTQFELLFVNDAAVLLTELVKFVWILLLVKLVMLE